MLWVRLPASKRVDPGGPRFKSFGRLSVDTRRKRCDVDGVSRRCSLGAWMFYVPSLESKLFHARCGLARCLHDPSPTLDEIRAGSFAGGFYTPEEWLDALTKPIERRLAEALIAARRLAVAGLGPPIGAMCLVGALAYGEAEDPSGTAGFEVADIRRLPKKRPCTREELLAAGVQPDRSESCLRQQKRGYVMDLSSTVPAMPIGADAEIAALTAEIRAEWDRLRAAR